MGRMSAQSSLGEVRPEHDRASDSELVLIHYVRAFALPVVDLWERITTPDRLAPWFGTIDGDCAAGELRVTSTDDCRSETATVTIRDCRSPHVLDIDFDGGSLELRLTQVGVVTTLEMTRRHLHSDDLSRVGPRWQYYLDRLESSIAQVPLPAWSDYVDLGSEYGGLRPS